MLGGIRELRSVKGDIGVMKSVKKKKGGVENSEVGLDRWCKRRAEMEREINGGRDKGNKKMESTNRERTRRSKMKKKWRV
ncbi:hypothetical protein K0M31_015999 [Melipona bicolor]|uniref:Uncharacterized protein n=1 Tax=Melipona bicolor TaxID=60889 RepID=A0AA40KT37_9HYME|nr:hypothetical protein K0M31_015999 [Melipona bicolor]